MFSRWENQSAKHHFKSPLWNGALFILKCQFKTGKFIFKCFKTRNVFFTTSNHFVLIKNVSMLCPGSSLEESMVSLLVVQSRQKFQTRLKSEYFFSGRCGFVQCTAGICTARGGDCGCKVVTGQVCPWPLLLVLAALPNLSVITTRLCGVLLGSYDPALKF